MSLTYGLLGYSAPADGTKGYIFKQKPYLKLEGAGMRGERERGRETLSSSLSIFGMFSLVYHFSFSSFNFSCFLWSLYALISGYNLSFRQKGSQPLKDNFKRWQGRVGKKICALDVQSDSKDKDATGLSKLPQFFIQRQASSKTVRFWSQLQCHVLDNFLWGKSLSPHT